MNDLTPVIKRQPDAMTMSFYDALRRIHDGKRVARVSWANSDYCFLKDGFLTIFTKDSLHSWVINDGDMEGEDWIIVTELN